MLAEIADSVGGPSMMLARGRLGDFAACCGNVSVDSDEKAVLDRATADLLGIEPGQAFLAMGR